MEKRIVCTGWYDIFRGGFRMIVGGVLSQTVRFYILCRCLWAAFVSSAKGFSRMWSASLKPGLLCLADKLRSQPERDVALNIVSQFCEMKLRKSSFGWSKHCRRDTVHILIMHAATLEPWYEIDFCNIKYVTWLWHTRFPPNVTMCCIIPGKCDLKEVWSDYMILLVARKIRSCEDELNEAFWGSIYCMQPLLVQITEGDFCVCDWRMCVVVVSGIGFNFTVLLGRSIVSSGFIMGFALQVCTGSLWVCRWSRCTHSLTTHY